LGAILHSLIITGIFSLFALHSHAQIVAPQPTQNKDSIPVKELDDITVTVSRVKEKMFRSPVTIEKANRDFFLSSSSPSFFDALEHVKGVQMITPGIGFRILNTRGFANTTNVRFAQLVDGMDVQSPHIGAPIGNALGPNDLDIDKVEILPGMSSALYGLNTINGLADFTTRNPFSSAGISVQQKTAIFNIGHSNTASKIFSETSLRIAHRFSDKIAFKLNGTFSKGKDWIADNYTDLNADANISTSLSGEDNPAKDPVNSYGNESSNRKTIDLQGDRYVVARTGYTEMSLTDYNINNIRTDGGFYVKCKNDVSLQYLFRFAFLDNTYQRSNRFALKNYFLQQHGLQFQSKSVQAKVYFNGENTGDSYNLRSMGENIDRDFKPDNEWYADYITGYNNAITNASNTADAHHAARNFADAGRYQPGTEAFNTALSKLQQINNWDSGAALKVKAGFIHAEIQINLTENWLSKLKTISGLDMLLGLDHRTYSVFPDGNYFINPVPGKENKNIYYSKTGGFLSIAKNLFENKLRLGFILRGDKNDYFPLLFNPRFTASYSPVRQHNIRFSLQSGYRYPVIFEAYSNVNSGGVKRVGGLPVMSQGIFESAWLQTSISSFQASVLNDINRNGMSESAAIEKNKSILKKNPYTYIRPEKVHSVELGYRGLFLENRLFLDADVYFNSYRSFIAQANMNVPKTSNPDSIPYYLYSNTNQSRYRMWTNSTTKVYNYGFSLGLLYRLKKGYTVNANTSFARLDLSDDQDGLEDGFNTPEWMVNLTISNNQISKRIGASMGMRWQSRFYWQSFLVSGYVPAFITLDANLLYTFSKEKFSIKAGGTNLLNRYYYSFLGGPRIGGFYYLTLTYGMN
jgi:iron complex outermembrane receptor protein